MEGLVLLGWGSGSVGREWGSGAHGPLMGVMGRESMIGRKKYGLVAGEAAPVAFGAGLELGELAVGGALGPAGHETATGEIYV